jgi:hypothetical protein
MATKIITRDHGMHVAGACNFTATLMAVRQATKPLDNVDTESFERAIEISGVYDNFTPECFLVKESLCPTDGVALDMEDRPYFSGAVQENMWLCDTWPEALALLTQRISE